MSDNTKVADLLPCPFCGPGESIVACCFDDVANRYRVYCGRCGSSTGIHPTDRTEAPAIAAWNRRAALARQDVEEVAPPAAQAVDLEKLRGAVEAYKAAVNEDCYFDPSDYDDNIAYADRLLALIDQQAVPEDVRRNSDRYLYLRRPYAWKEGYIHEIGGISPIYVSDGQKGTATDTNALDAAVDAAIATTVAKEVTRYAARQPEQQGGKGGV